jgi:hypothetical protein
VSAVSTYHVLRQPSSQVREVRHQWRGLTSLQASRLQYDEKTCIHTAILVLGSMHYVLHTSTAKRAPIAETISVKQQLLYLVLHRVAVVQVSSVLVAECLSSVRGYYLRACISVLLAEVWAQCRLV